MTSHTTLRAGRNRNRDISLPDMGPFAGVVFLVVCFYMLAGRFRHKEDGIVSDAKLPYSTTYCGPPENIDLIISLNAQNKLSFGVSSKPVQIAAIQKVAARHGIGFSDSQLTALKAAPFLATDVESMPAFLSLPEYQRIKSVEQQKLSRLSEKQLLECIVAAKASAQTLYRMPVYTCLKIESDANMVHVEHLIDLLQRHGINRFNLKTQSE
jgi:biopolymer transport protein ExbD